MRPTKTKAPFLFKAIVLGWGVINLVTGHAFAGRIPQSLLKVSPQGGCLPEASPTLADQLDISTPKPAQEVAQGYRDPKEAIVFLDKFDSQLGLSPEMKSEKRSLMAESAHAFYRATPALFYHDLQSSFKNASRLLPEPAPPVAIVGDAHLLNAGTFRGPDGKTVWGLNDFDQAAIGSPEWDLERMGVSLYVAGRSGGLSSEDALKLVRKMGESYLASLGEEKPAYLTKHETTGKIEELIDKASSKTEGKFLAKLTTADGQMLKRNEKLVNVASQRDGQIRQALTAKFSDLKVLDLASKPHSGGSTRGLERYYALVESPQRSSPWLMEIKEVLPSPVQIADADLSRGDGDAILSFQKQMGSPVDYRHKAFKLDNIAFFTREREPEKASLKDSPKHITEAAAPLGKLLARAHNSSGANIKGWINGRNDKLLANLEHFSKTYARQVESDYRELCAAARPLSAQAPIDPFVDNVNKSTTDASGYIISY